MMLLALLMLFFASTKCVFGDVFCGATVVLDALKGKLQDDKQTPKTAESAEGPVASHSSDAPDRSGTRSRQRQSNESPETVVRSDANERNKVGTLNRELVVFLL